MTTEQLDELAALDAAATKDWRIEQVDYGDDDYVMIDAEIMDPTGFVCSTSDGFAYGRPENIRLAVALRNAAPWLIERAKLAARLETRIVELERDAARWRFVEGLIVRQWNWDEMREQYIVDGVDVPSDDGEEDGENYVSFAEQIDAEIAKAATGSAPPAAADE